MILFPVSNTPECETFSNLLPPAALQMPYLLLIAMNDSK